jgi:antitoxin (DNA-binding transcriptional repressor) of toxin-antitoxin stability system
MILITSAVTPWQTERLDRRFHRTESSDSKFFSTANEFLYHGAPVARLVPVRKEASTEQRAAAIRRIQKLAAGLSLGGLKIRDLINEGRTSFRASSAALMSSALSSSARCSPGWIAANGIVMPIVIVNNLDL